MATLPDYTALGERPVPRGDGGVVSYDPTVGKGLQQVGQGIAQASGALGQASNVLASMADRQDSIIALDSATKLKQAALDLEHSDTGFMNVKMGGVLGDFDKTYREKFEAIKSHIQDGLTNEGQKRTFSRYADVVGLQYESSLLQHKANQTLAYNQQVMNDSIKTHALYGASDPTNNDLFLSSMVEISGIIAKDAATKGLGAEYINLRSREIGGEIMRSRITGALIKDSTGKYASELLNSPAGRAYLDQNQKNELGAKIRTVEDGQSLRSGSEAALQRAQGVSTFSGVAVDHHADRVPVINDKDVVRIINRVNTPSKWDTDISNAAAQYNIDPKDLKLQLVRESDLNENTRDSDQGAQGIAQFKPETAKNMGFNPRDPKASIFGAARLLSSAGPDPHQRDIAYYGPGSPNGPNTKQYAANGDVLRYALKGEAPARPQVTEASLVGSEAAVIQQAKAIAEEKYPGDKVWADRQVADARSQLAQQISAFRAKEYENYSGILDVSVGETGVKSLAELNTKFPGMIGSYEALSPEKKHSLERLWHSNSTTVAETPENTNTYLQLMGKAVTDPVGFKRLNIAEETKDLPQSRRTEVLHAFISIDKESAKGAQYKRVLEDTAVKRMISDSGITIPTEKSGQKDKDRYELLAGQIRNSVDNFVDINGKQPTENDYNKIVSKLLLPAVEVYRPAWFNTQKKPFEVEPGTTIVKGGKHVPFEKYTVDNPARPMTQEAFDALPDNTPYVNPADGRRLRKKPKEVASVTGAF
jgi:hypothetical protein